MPAVEFGTKTAAHAYREEYPEHIYSDDDARLKTVTFTSDVPEWLLEQARLEGDEGPWGHLPERRPGAPDRRRTGGDRLHRDHGPDRPDAQGDLPGRRGQQLAHLLE